MRSEAHFIQPEELAGVTDLQLLARTVVEGFMAGLHRSPHFGASIEFAQYRPYVQGDDPRFVDWDLYARTDRLHTKQFHEESNLRCTLLLDSSASMQYGSGALTKFHYARMMAACLAYLLIRQNDAAGLSVFDSGIQAFLPPRASKRHLQRILVELTHAEASGETDLSGSIQRVNETAPPNGMVIVISDLLEAADEIAKQIRLLRARRFDVLVMQISDPAEQTFTFDKDAQLLDLETSRTQWVDPDEVREQYLKNRNRHFDELRAACLTARAEIDEFNTAEPFDRSLYFFLRARNQILAASSGKWA